MAQRMAEAAAAERQVAIDKLEAARAMMASVVEGKPPWLPPGAVLCMCMLGRQLGEHVS